MSKNISTTVIPNNNSNMYISTTSNDPYISFTIDDDFIKFFELILAALGQNITFKEFKNMSDIERNKLLRDLKLKTIL